MSKVNFSPRRVWLGATIPGKKMFRMAVGEETLHRGVALIDCYKAAPSEALQYAAIALHLVPEQGSEFGPAFRDIHRPLQAGRLSGAILTDIRDFLKFRYRASGRQDGTDPPSTGALSRGDLPKGVEPESPDLVINYAVAALDVLSKAPELAGAGETVVKAIHNLRDLLEQTAKLVRRLEVGDEAWEEWVGKDWDDRFPWKSG